MIVGSPCRWFSLFVTIGTTLFLAVYSFSQTAFSQEGPVYRSEAIIQVKGLNNRPPEDREILLGNLRARLTDWSVLRNAVKGLGENREDIRKRVRDVIDAEIVEDDRFRIWLDHDDPEECRKVLSNLTNRIVSEGIEIGESERLVFLRDQLDKALEVVEDAEKQLDDFVREHKAFLSEKKMVGAIAEDTIRISNYEIEIEEARAQKRILQKKLSKTPESIVTATVIQYGPEVRKLKSTISAKEEKLDGLIAKYGTGKKAAKLERQIRELKLKLEALEGRSQKQEIRSSNPLYEAIVAELLEMEELIKKIEEDIEKAKEHIATNKQTLKETAKIRRDKRRLDRDYDEGVRFFKVLQDKLEEEYYLRALGGGKLEVLLVLEPTSPRRAQ